MDRKPAYQGEKIVSRASFEPYGKLSLSLAGVVLGMARGGIAGTDDVRGDDVKVIARTIDSRSPAYSASRPYSMYQNGGVSLASLDVMRLHPVNADP